MGCLIPILVNLHAYSPVAQSGCGLAFFFREFANNLSLVWSILFDKSVKLIYQLHIFLLFGCAGDRGLVMDSLDSCCGNSIREASSAAVTEHSFRSNLAAAVAEEHMLAAGSQDLLA